MKIILLVALVLIIWFLIRRRGGSYLLDLAVALLPLALLYEIIRRFAGEGWQWAVAAVFLAVGLYIFWRRKKGRFERR